jgi:hypothetical protein
MAGEIRTAVERVNERKRAILGDETQAIVGDDDLLRLVSGFDLDPQEFRRVADMAEHIGLAQALQAGVVNPILRMLWVDGLVMGLLIAEARERTAAGA